MNLGQMWGFVFPKRLSPGPGDIQTLVKQKIGGLIHALSADEENNQEEARLRQRITKGLFYVLGRSCD